MKRKNLIALLMAFIWVWAGLPGAVQAVAYQQEQGPQMKATAAYEGYFKYGEWLPVWVELENNAADVDGEVRVQVSGSQGTTVFTAPVSLPAGSRKSFPVYVLPNNFSREIKVDLVSKDKVLISQKVAVRPQPNISFFVGLLTPERGALSLLNGVELPGQNRPKIIADVLLDELTERPEGLRSFDVIIINNTDTSRLTPQQAEALTTWVQLGGRLVIGGGPGTQQTLAGLPENLLPVAVQGSLEIGQEALQDLARFAGAGQVETQGTFVAAVGQLNESKLLAGSDALPIVAERAVGSGAVDFVALDVSAVPFNGWPGTQDFWETLLAPGAAYPDTMPYDISVRQMRANQLGYALSNIPALDLPSVQGLSILLAFYILIVGPINYIVLRWRRRLQLAWVTIPVITVLFTAGAFGIGYAMRGTDLIMNQIALVQAQPGGSAAVTSYLGLFSPRQQSYEIVVDGSGLISPMTGYDPGPWDMNGNPVNTGAEMVFVQGQPSVVKGLTVNQFAMQSFMAEETWQDFGQLSADLTLKNDTLVGTVKNETAYKLTDVVVTVQNRFARLGDLEPGQEATVDIGLGALQNDRFGPPLSYRLFQENNPNGMLSRENELKTNILSSVLDNGGAWMKMALSSTFPAGGGVASMQRSNPVMIFGWLKQAPPNVEVRNNRLSRQTTALVYTSTTYHMPLDGAFTIPAGMIPGNLTEIPPQGGTCGPYGMASVSMGQGEAGFEFQIPAEIRTANLKELKLNIWRDSGGNWGMPEIALWDWQSEDWKILQEPIMGMNIIVDPATYINESGVVRVRLTSENNMFSCTYLDMGLEAEGTGSATSQGGAQ